jgi:hypothetical protein
MAKWRPRTVERPLPVAAPTPIPPSPPVVSKPRLVPILAAGLAGAAILVGSFWYFSIRPRVQAIEGVGAKPGREKTIKAKKSSARGFDLAFNLPGSPLGATTDGSEIIIGNRSGPWGAMRLMPVDKTTFVGQEVPIIEPRFNQQISLNAVTWNGTNYVGLTTGAWFQQNGDVFTIHDRSTLKVLEWKPAPPYLGCLAWDGKSYWASTRKNTMESTEPALLYHLDASFNVLWKGDSFGVGCQGLAWDGKYLWSADVFSDAVYVIDVSGEMPQLVQKNETDLSYLSGIVARDGSIFVTEYEDNRLHRLEERTRVAWAGGAAAPLQPVIASAAAAVTPVPDQGNIPALRHQLRSDHWAERMRAEMELKKLGAPIDYDRDQNNFVDRKNDDTEIIDWSAEARDGSIYGTWSIWFGPDLFNRVEATGPITVPQFARYTITVNLPNGEKVVKEFEAQAGDNRVYSRRLADATLTGEYSIEIFLHVQYYADGTAKILNRSGSSLSLKL